MKQSRFFHISLLITIMILFTASCGPEIVPIRGTDGIVNVESKSFTLEKEGVVITVVSDAWSYEPIDVRYNFTPFLISVHNKTTEPITIDAEHIFMFDDYNNQYGVIMAEHVDRAVYSSRSYPPVIFYGGNYYYRSWGGLGLEFAYPYNYSQYDSKVIPNAFRFGPIASGARAKGFVYMQKYSAAAKGLKLVITPTKVFADGSAVPLDKFTFDFEVIN